MFIRKTQTRTGKDGKAYSTYRLVKSVREGKKVRQVTMLNLGSQFDIPKEDWPLLCQRITDIHKGQSPLFAANIPEAVEAEAQRIAALLLVQGGTGEPDGDRESREPDLETVDLATLEVMRPRSIGVEHVGLWAMAQVGFAETLAAQGLGPRLRAAVIGSIIGRMANPGSERATYEWLCEQSGLGELLGVDYEAMSLMQLYRASDALLACKDELEGGLFARVQNLFGLSCTVTLYDLTNTYFEGELTTNPKAKRGHSKEKRSDAPLLTLGLVLDGSGFARRSEIFPGNVGEPGTMQEILERLEAPRGAVVILDRGIATEDNITWLREHGYHYLVVSRKQRREFDADLATPLTTASGDTIHIYKTAEADGEVNLLCYSERRAKKEEGIVRRFTERFEAELHKIAAGLSKPRTMKRIDKLWERIGRLKAKSRGVGNMYDIELIPDDTGKIAKEIRWQRREANGTMVSHPGVYCLRTNLLQWDAERLWRTYIMLTDLEAVFRSLKSELGLRPMYHRKAHRCDGHLFISVLAYQFVQIIRTRLRAAGITESWQRIRTSLSSQRRVTVTFRRADGRTLNVRKATLPELGQRRIYQALGLDMQPGGIQKLVQ
ncbi:IS1634 family transposase [Candidatus Parcubacteria bacterium]|nr:MAG: IS1634 family transposase [Candidatus Parcubacteria bacterium]